MLEAESVPFVALDLDADRVREAATAGASVVLGDATRRETLLAAGLHRAAVLVVTYDDTPTTVRLLKVVRELAPQLPVVGRELSSLPLEGCDISAVVQEGRRRLQWPSDLRLQAGDTLVLVGTVEQVNAAEDRLVRHRA